MKNGLKPYTLGLYEKSMPSGLTWQEKLCAAKNAGYDFIELSIDETDQKLARLDMPQRERRELVNIMYETELPIRTMCLSGHRKYPLGSTNPETRKKSMEILEKAICLAEDLGIRIIQLAGYDVYYEPSTEATRTLFEANLHKAVSMAAGAGVLLGFETMETEFMNTVQKSMSYIRKVHSPYLHVYPDVGNLTNAAVKYGTDVQNDIRCGAGHLIAVHLKETVPGKFREIRFGSGHVDFPALIHEAWQSGARRYVAEFWYCGSPDWEKDLTFARTMMGRILDRETAMEGIAI